MLKREGGERGRTRMEMWVIDVDVIDVDAEVSNP